MHAFNGLCCAVFSSGALFLGNFGRKAEVHFCRHCANGQPAPEVKSGPGELEFPRSLTELKRRRQLVQKFSGLTLKGVSGSGRFSGYASVFGEVDLGLDIIEPGAFAQSLKNRGPGGIRMLYQHDPNQPIGTWDVLKEDSRGLYVEGQLSPDVARAREVLALMKQGALDGLSIGFQTMRAKGDAKSGVRRITQADLWEISIVTFPMAPSARVSDVKQQHFFRDRETELVRAMRRAAVQMKKSIFKEM